jgi:hypothetical protein
VCGSTHLDGAVGFVGGSGAAHVGEDGAAWKGYARYCAGVEGFSGALDV